jgi:hypothetical protein
MGGSLAPVLTMTKGETSKAVVMAESNYSTYRDEHLPGCVSRVTLKLNLIAAAY